MFLAQKSSVFTSKDELVKKVEAQEKQIAKYEKKLKEVINAYKSLKSEKEALEQSLEALTGGENPSEPEKTNEEDNKEQETTTTTEATPSSDNRIETLRKALSTLTSEKNLVEAALKQDKKALLVEQDSLREQLEKNAAEFEKQKTLLEQQFKEVRASLRQNQIERECEQSDHAAMIKELQQKLGQERVLNECLTREKNNLKKELDQKSEEPFEYQDRIAELNSELSKLRTQLADQRKINEFDGPQIQKLRKELVELKEQQKRIISQERDRILAVESQMRNSNEIGEGRVNALELRISELSGMLGENERQHQQDMAVIEKLKVRCNHLDQENTALARAAALQDESVHSQEDFERLKEKLKRIVEKLRSAELSFETRINFYELLHLESPDGESVHSNCEVKYNRLQDEFEKYKLRAQAVLKSKKSGKDEEHSETDQHHFKSVIASLQSRIQELQEESQRSETRFQESSQRLKDTISRLEKSHERQLTGLRQESQRKESELEKEMQRMRARTLDIMAEKEQELETMRTILETVRGDVPNDPKDPQEGKSASSPLSVSPGESGSGEVPNVFYSQELAKKELEIAGLRKDLREKDGALRDLQHSAVTKELMHYETLEKLKEEMRVLEGKLSMDANLEYLRNVSIQYMLCDKPDGKEHMLKAIGKSLGLSRNQMDQIRKHNARWYWWNSTKTAPPSSNP